MNFQQFLLILKARRREVIHTLLATVALMALISALWPSSYTATTAVVLDSKAADPLSGTPQMVGMMPFNYMATQIEIIASARVAGKVVKALKLDENPTVIADWKDDTKGRGDIVAWVAKRLLRKLDVKPARESNVINIEFTARDPKVAMMIANQFARAYVDTTLELKIEPARQYAAWFSERTKALREDLERAQTRLSENQRKMGIVAVDERLDVESARLAELSTQLTVVQGQKADTFSRQNQAQGDKSILPEVLQSSLVQSLKADIARGEAKLDELASQIGRNHPLYQRTEAELKALRQKMESETGRVASSIGTSNRVNLQREAEIKETLEKQKDRVLELKKQRDEIAVLQRDVESARHAYDLITQRLSQSSLESQINQTNVAILHPATEPVEPSFPRLSLNLILAVFIGIPLGIAVAMLREMYDARVRSEEDVIQILQLPMLGLVEKDPAGVKMHPWARWFGARAPAAS